MAEARQGWLQGMMSSFGGQRPPRVSPMKEAGTSGTAIFGGYVEVIEKSPLLSSGRRYETAADMLANVSILAAGLRFFLNLTAKPSWKFEPAKDLPGGQSSDAAKQAAEFMQSVIDGMETKWTRIVRRSGMYRFHGFGIQEWTAKRREDGMIGLLDVESRPAWTIEQWERDESGKILGVWQRSPQTGEKLWIPREKVLYLVEDSLTDSPEGMGLYRHIVDPAERLRRYLKLETLSFERDLRGIPLGKAPLSDINAAVAAGAITKEEGETMLRGLRNFVKLQVKAEDTGLIMDSRTYEGATADGTTVSSAAKWGVELLNAQGSSFADLGRAIERLTGDIARILGTENLLLGGGASGSGNRALSEDKSRNLYLSVNSTLVDLAEGTERDIIGPVWRLNGLPDRLRPRCKVEDVAFRDVEAVAATLRDMATAGAVLAPDDPVVDDVRDLLGVSRQPEMTPARMALLTPTPPAKPEEPSPEDDAGGGPPTNA